MLAIGDGSRTGDAEELRAAIDLQNPEIQNIKMGVDEGGKHMPSSGSTLPPNVMLPGGGNTDTELGVPSLQPIGELEVKQAARSIQQMTSNAENVDLTSVEAVQLVVEIAPKLLASEIQETGSQTNNTVSSGEPTIVVHNTSHKGDIDSAPLMSSASTGSTPSKYDAGEIATPLTTDRMGATDTKETVPAVQRGTSHNPFETTPVTSQRVLSQNNVMDSVLQHTAAKTLGNPPLTTKTQVSDHISGQSTKDNVASNVPASSMPFRTAVTQNVSLPLDANPGQSFSDGRSGIVAAKPDLTERQVVVNAPSTVLHKTVLGTGTQLRSNAVKSTQHGEGAGLASWMNGNLELSPRDSISATLARERMQILSSTNVATHPAIPNNVSDSLLRSPLSEPAEFSAQISTRVDTHVIDTSRGNGESLKSVVAGVVAEAVVKGSLDSQVHDQFMRVMANRAMNQTRLTLQLHPRELGAIDIAFSKDRGDLNVVIVAREPVTKDLLDMLVPRIRQSLQDMGVDVGDLDVSQEDTTKGSTADKRNAESQQRASNKVSDDNSSQDDPSHATAQGLVDGRFDLYI